MDKDPTSDEPAPEKTEPKEEANPAPEAQELNPQVQEKAEASPETSSDPLEAKVESEGEETEKAVSEGASSEKADAPKEETPSETEEAPVDLSALQGFDFGTSWSESKPVGGNRGRSERRTGGGRPPRGDRGERKDRRAFKPGGFRKAPRRESGDSQGRPVRGGQPGRRPQHGRPEAPRRVVEVSFYPEDNGFKALCKALRISTITYELFDIARTILEKDERFYMIIRPVDAKGAPDEEASIYVSEADGIPFLNEEGASMHALSGCLDHFFTSETQEVEPPSGSFSSVRKCGFTGELLGPPNFHRIQKIMADHHASRLSHMPYAKFESRIEAISDEEVIAEWLEKMKTQVSYTLKPEFGEARKFEDGETARAYVKANLGEKLVREVKSARVEGAQISKVKDGLLRANLEFSWERQKRFPLDTANLLRGRLRRQKFALYKKGSKGVSYVCAVKRRFREPNESFSQPIQELLTFLDANPNLAVKDLAEKYLGFSTHAAEGEEAKELSAEQQQKHKAMTLDFQWLLKEGYIAEYSDGTIFAHPPAGPGQGVVPKKAVASSTPEVEKAESPVVESTPESTEPASSDPVEKTIPEVAEPEQEAEVAESSAAMNSADASGSTETEDTTKASTEPVIEATTTAEPEPVIEEPAASDESDSETSEDSAATAPESADQVPESESAELSEEPEATESDSVVSDVSEGAETKPDEVGMSAEVESSVEKEASPVDVSEETPAENPEAATTEEKPKT